MPPAPDSQPLSLVPRVGGPSSPPWGGGWVCLGSPRSSLANLALVFSLLLLSLASKSQLVRMCVCVCVCLSLSLSCPSMSLCLSVWFCLCGRLSPAQLPSILKAAAPLSLPLSSVSSPPSSQDSTELTPPRLPPCRLSPCLPSSGSTVSSHPALWRRPRQRPTIPPLGGCALCVWCAPSHPLGAGTVPSPRTRHADHSGWNLICWLRDLPPWLPLCAILGIWATGHKQGRRGPASTNGGGWKPGVSLQH